MKLKLLLSWAILSTVILIYVGVENNKMSDELYNLRIEHMNLKNELTVAEAQLRIKSSVPKQYIGTAGGEPFQIIEIK